MPQIHYARHDVSSDPDFFCLTHDRHSRRPRNTLVRQAHTDHPTLNAPVDLAARCRCGGFRFQPLSLVRRIRHVADVVKRGSRFGLLNTLYSRTDRRRRDLRVLVPHAVALCEATTYPTAVLFRELHVPSLKSTMKSWASCKAFCDGNDELEEQYRQFI